MIWFSFSQMIAKASAVQWLRPQRKCIFREFEGQWQQRFGSKAANVQCAKKCNLYAECCDIEAEYKIIPGGGEVWKYMQKCGNFPLDGEDGEEVFYAQHHCIYLGSWILWGIKKDTCKYNFPLGLSLGAPLHMAYQCPPPSISHLGKLRSVQRRNHLRFSLRSLMS